MERGRKVFGSQVKDRARVGATRPGRATRARMLSIWKFTLGNSTKWVPLAMLEWNSGEGRSTLAEKQLRGRPQREDARSGLHPLVGSMNIQAVQR